MHTTLLHAVANPKEISQQLISLDHKPNFFDLALGLYMGCKKLLIWVYERIVSWVDLVSNKRALEGNGNRYKSDEHSKSKKILVIA